MTSSEIRQSFLDFFKSKQHTIVPSSSLMPDSPNLLFTNAGMNQFVPIFLGQVKCPYNPPRAADTQKCIRAGGKHNDLDDVGLDTYHHTFFEMLGNWSFGDYFKKEAIEWAWELVTEVWKFPKNRLYATVYSPDKAQGDPSEFDQEAYDFWAAKFSAAGLDPKVHIVYGNKKDNFWMMGETGPCGPCSELHVDLTPAGDTKGSLVNKGDARCIEIWNLVFIQFNANPDGTFSPLPAKHVDTGMGFERATSIIQGTKNFKDFANAKISNYETDIFRPIFDAIEKLSGKKYGSTLPTHRVNEDGKEVFRGANETENTDIAFRVMADHIRTLSFSIADGIQPGIKGRNGVLRSIHKRMLRYASTIGIEGNLLLKTQDALVDTLTETMGTVFPEIGRERDHIKKVLRQEADVFNRTLQNGLAVFEEVIFCMKYLEKRIGPVREALSLQKAGDKNAVKLVKDDFMRHGPSKSIRFEQAGGDQMQLNIGERIDELVNFDQLPIVVVEKLLSDFESIRNRVSGGSAFLLSDTYGFPYDLTELMARERGLTVDRTGFDKLMEEQKKRSQDARETQVIELSQIQTKVPTKFVGYEVTKLDTKIVEAVRIKDKTAVVFEASPLYAEMGGQVGDTGIFASLKGDYMASGQKISNTQKSGNVWLHFVEKIREDLPEPQAGDAVLVVVDEARRNAIQRHHTVTHLMHWALHEVVSKEASQKGSFVGPDKLTFDFNSPALTPGQVSEIEKLVNERILENAGVSWTEVPHADVKNRKDVMQFFGDKYGDLVRVVQIGGHAGKLDGYSMELCGGTHTRATGEIGLFRIVGESAVAAGVRRIEAIAGLQAYAKTKHDAEVISSVAGKVNAPIGELEKKIEALLVQQKELEKSLRAAKQKEAAGDAKSLLAKAETINGIPAIITNISSADGDTLQTIADALKGEFKGVVVLGGVANGAVSLVASVSSEFTSMVQAGKIIQGIAPIVGGKGGGKPDNARGGGKEASKLGEALAKAKSLLG